MGSVWSRTRFTGHSFWQIMTSISAAQRLTVWDKSLRNNYKVASLWPILTLYRWFQFIINCELSNNLLAYNYRFKMLGFSVFKNVNHKILKIRILCKGKHKYYLYHAWQMIQAAKNIELIMKPGLVEGVPSRAKSLELDDL